MRFTPLFLSAVLLLPATAYAAEFAYERNIIVPPLTEDTAVWIPLDTHALLDRIHGYEIMDTKGNVVPMNQLNESVNLLKDATIDVSPEPADTVPTTKLQI